jgi:hypothetical protein
MTTNEIRNAVRKRNARLRRERQESRSKQRDTNRANPCTSGKGKQPRPRWTPID